MGRPSPWLGRKEESVPGKISLQQRDKVSTCMVKIGQEVFMWKAGMMSLLRMKAGKGIKFKGKTAPFKIKEIDTAGKSIS